ncbi:reverse transcriptase domain-containing protein [Tanacetum coccineum]
MNISSTEEDKIPWFADFSNYLVGKILRKGLTYTQRCKFFSELKHYFWDEPYLFKMCPDGIIRRCVYGAETQKILNECHHVPTGGHYGPSTTAKKVFYAGFYWPTIFKEAHTLVQNCDTCQRSGSLPRRDEMPQNSIQFEYILVAINYVSKWAKAEALPTNDAQVVINFLKRPFSRFGIPKALISDKGTHFCNRQMEKVLKQYGVHHRFATAYHPQTSGQALRSCNLDLKLAREKRFLKLHELDELRLQAYENFKLYKARIKAYHDTKLRIQKEFKAVEKVLLYNSKYKFKAPKLRSKWYGPFMVKHGFLSSYVELYDKHGGSFIVNGHRVKLYHDEE